MKNYTAKEIGFHFWEAMSKMAANRLTDEEIAARKAKGKPVTLMEAVAELIVPEDDGPNKYNGTYRCYSVRSFDQGNCGNPAEYAGIQISFKVGGCAVQIDTKYGNIRVWKGSEMWQMSLGKQLIDKLDDIGQALWAEWDDSTAEMVETLREVEDQQTWLLDEDYEYLEQQSWSGQTDSRSYSVLRSAFERDIAGGIRYTDRDDEPTGIAYRRAQQACYKELLEEQLRLQREYAKAEIAKKKYQVTGVSAKAPITWETMAEEQREKALAAYRAKKAQ